MEQILHSLSDILARLHFLEEKYTEEPMLTFRVPYRNYQNLWLLAWVDERPNSVAKGSLRFYHETAGYPAMTDFEISPEAIQKGLVTKLAQKTANGKQLYLVKVPVNTPASVGEKVALNVVF